jgi:hypothetical protein
MNETENNYWLETFYYFGTAVSGLFTAHLFWTITENSGIPDWLRLFAALGLAYVILDGGLLMLNYSLPKAKSKTQRKIIIAAMGIWWLAMLATSLGDGIVMMQASKPDTTENIYAISVIVISGVSNFVVLLYMILRYTDPEIQNQLAERISAMEQRAEKIRLMSEARKKLLKEFAMQDAFAELKTESMAYFETNKEMSERLAKVLRGAETLPEIEDSQNGRRPKQDFRQALPQDRKSRK